MPVRFYRLDGQIKGRSFGDKGVGQPACKDKYAVDYVICFFETKETCPFYSDTRNMIKLSLTSNVTLTQSKASSCPELNINVGKN